MMTIEEWDMILGEFMMQILNSWNVDNVQIAERNFHFADWSFVYNVDLMDGGRC